MNYYRQYQETDIGNILHGYMQGSDEVYRQISADMALRLFHEMARRVPAYKHFLRKHHIRPDSINTMHDLLRVPLTDKPTYIDAYPVHDLCWDGTLDTSYFLSSSSGSLGQAYFWPRSPEQTYQGALISEVLYRNIFHCDKTPTLYINAFAQGMWVAGTYMTMATEWAAQKGLPITVAAPGLSKDEIVRLIDFGTKYYKQIILVGYPPFVKDIVDTSIERGVDWSKIHVKLLFSGEAFTERWRDHMQKKTHFANIYTDAINIYGSADVGLIAHETPTSIYMRRLAAENADILQSLFHANRVPSVSQYDPSLRHFEQVDGDLVVTARSGIPLMRYTMKDVGNVLYFEEAQTILKEYGIDMNSAFRKAKPALPLWRIPFVYLFGRGKFTATLYGITIFPEYVKYVLDHGDLEKILTGKFMISTEETKDHGQELHLHVELRDSVAASLSHEKRVAHVFVEEVPNVSSEYKHLLARIRHKAYPKVILHPYGDPAYFPRGVVKKTA